MELRVNTRQMEENGEELIRISDDVAKQIDLLYAKLNHLVADGVWQGISANKYYQKMLPYKEELLGFNRVLKKYGNYLIKNSERLENFVKKV